MASEVCPLLGLDDDRGAYLTYPSYENRCHASAAAESIPLNEQTFFCLGGHMERCPRYQARQASQPEATPESGVAGPALAAAGGAALAASDSVPQTDQPATIASEDDFSWTEAAAAMGWAEVGPDLPPPPPPPAAWLEAGPGGQSRKPVWPLLLAAGTLVGVLMLCALASAGWIGIRALSSQLAINTTTPAAVAGGTGVPPQASVTAQESAIPTATLEPPLATALAAVLATETSVAATTTSAAVLPTESPSPTEFIGVVETPTFDASTPTPTWTPFVFETPTPRDTPIIFPTNTPANEFPTSTFTPIPTLGATATPISEPFFVSFVANPTSIIPGQTSTLTWTVRGVKAIYLDGEAVSGPTGSQVVKPSATTTYVLRIIMPDNTVREEAQTVTVAPVTPSVTPTASPSPTITPTATATPICSASFAQNLSITIISGQESTCRVDNGCTQFQIQVRNTGNRSIQYALNKDWPAFPGWGVFFCWAAECEFADNPPARSLASGQRDTVALNFRVPASITEPTTMPVVVKGFYLPDGCPAPGQTPVFQQVYENTFQVKVIPPAATFTPTSTPTITPTPTLSPTPTLTPVPTQTTGAG